MFLDQRMLPQFPWRFCTLNRGAEAPIRTYCPNVKELQHWNIHVSEMWLGMNRTHMHTQIKSVCATTGQFIFTVFTTLEKLCEAKKGWLENVTHRCVTIFSVIMSTKLWNMKRLISSSLPYRRIHMGHIMIITYRIGSQLLHWDYNQIQSSLIQCVLKVSDYTFILYQPVSFCLFWLRF